jgi:hypothetical protein
MEDENVDRSRLEKGEYANYFEVGHDFVAFFVDCGQAGQGVQRTKLYNRIITSPIGAQQLSVVLSKALREYTRRFGPIRDEQGMISSAENEHEQQRDH